MLKNQHSEKLIKKQSLIQKFTEITEQLPKLEREVLLRRKKFSAIEKELKNTP